MNNKQAGVNLKYKYLLLAFFMLVGFHITFGQKRTYKDYIIGSFTNEKTVGKVSLNKKFWYSTIYFENKDQGIFEYYYPHQLRSFTKGDSLFVVVRVDYKKFKENGISRRNYALLLNDTSAVKLYKSYIPVENGKLKEIFFYSKQETRDSPTLIEDNKSSVLATVSDSKSLTNDINKFGYEYNESYFKRLFDNYNKRLKDTTATIVHVATKSIQKSDSIISSDNSSIPPSTNVSATPIAKLDSISQTDTTTIAPSSNVSEIVKSDNIPSSDASAVAMNEQNSQEPLVDGFASGDSILFEFNGLYPGEFLNHTKKGKCSIKYQGMGGKWKTQTVNLPAVYQTTEHPENKANFGYEIGESANIEVFVTKLNSKVIKPCTIVGLNPNRLVISYQTDEGKERVLSVDKGMIKE